MLVEFIVAVEHRQTFIDAMSFDGRGSLPNEPGTLRFDIYEDSEEPGRFYLNEAFEDEAAFQAHMTGAYYPAVVKVLESLREQGAMTSRRITRSNPIFVARALGWDMENVAGPVE